MSASGTGESHTVELRLGADDLVRALLALDPARRLHLLDSCGARGGGARYLLAGFDPSEYVEARGAELRVVTRGSRETVVRGGTALEFLDERLREKSRGGNPPGEVPSRGACFVTLSYELARQFERQRAGSGSAARNAPPRADGPDAVFAFFDALVVHDYERGTTHLAGGDVSRARLREAARTLFEAASSRACGDPEAQPGGGSRTGPPPRGERLALPQWATSNFTRAEYEAAVGRVREHILAGDVYQANLTQRIACRPRPGVTPERVFLRLRGEHPASFAAFLRQGARTVVSASPERFLRVADEGGRRVVEAWPIKGTRPRGAGGAEDARLRAELLASAKDRAENVMIVDLMRNDLGRVCLYGSVEVAELCALQEHPTLFHLVSKVRGVLREGVTAGELLRAAFPCGSITGAPKVRAVEILRGIESAARGVSMGSIGYFSYGGAADLNVAIRTITFGADGAARFHVGGAVVSDSDPAAEYEETLVKARALLRALGGGGED